MKLTCGQALDRGVQRTENQDVLGVYWPRLLRLHPPLLAIADGMGGHAGGALAARHVIRAVMWRHFLTFPRKAEQARVALARAVEDAHRSVCRAARGKPGLEKMGSTLAAVLLFKEQLVGVNVGDSRVYRLRGEVLEQISRDQSLVGDLLQDGAITREEARVYPKRNQLNMSISAGREVVQPHFFECGWQAGDSVLLCSDGLWAVMPEAEMAHFVCEFPPVQAARGLLREVYTYGAPDNISIIIVHAGG